MFVDVAVPAPLAGALTYALPARFADIVEPGSRVLVELGRRRVAGVVLERHARSPAAGMRVKDVLEVVEREPVVQAELLRFLRELADYYLAPIGEVVRVAMPAIDRADAARLAEQGLDDGFGAKVAGGKRVRYVESTDVVEAAGALRGQALSVLHYLRANGITPLSRLAGTWKNARPAVKKLLELGLVRVEEREAPRDPFFRDAIARDAEPTPTGAQTTAIDALTEAIVAGAPKAFLLHGITGSGKTEVYLRAIATAREQGKGALMLVPEIALTPQLVGRFRARFGDGLAVLHSGLSQRDRHAMWRSLRAGQVQVAIGARSALFAPVPSLGLIVVDEEHDGSFKQEEGVRYHARDMAMLRAHRAGAVCVLGSATPSLETEHLARSGKIVRLTLPARARESATLPEIVTVDLRRTGPGPLGDRRLSLPLHRKILEALGRGDQTILFLNRRGFAPSVVCEACGVIATCHLCSVALTFHHRGGRLRCHYCDAEEPFTEKCRACGSPDVALEGAGTERLEQAVAEAYPAARIARVDRDVAAGARAEAVFKRLRDREIDILIGTQMVAKGHDVPSVTLVGVINADAALSMPDFRASERTFQLLVQVAGRAGRGDDKGTVIFQTRDPQHPAIVCARTHDVASFAERELRMRAELGYPPFSRLALVRIDAPKEDDAREAAAALGRSATATAAVREGAVDVLGPAPAPLSRLRGRYRFRLLLKARGRPELRSVLRAIAEAAPQVAKRARVVLDVDPVSML